MSQQQKKQQVTDLLIQKFRNKYNVDSNKEPAICMLITEQVK